MANMQQQANSAGKDLAHQGREAAKAMKEDLREGVSNAKDTANRAMKTAQDAAPELTERLYGALDDIKSTLSKVADGSRAYADRGEAFIKKYPIATVLGAAAAGIIISRLLFRPKASQE